MKHDHKQIKPQTNYTLIKPDEESDKYHLDGKETSIYVGKSFMKYIDEHDSLDFEMKEMVDTQAQHWPITGTVICAPQKNVFYGHDIKKLIQSRGESIDPDDMKQANKMKDASVEYQSPVEVKEGDRVIFDYGINMRCYEDGQYFHTDIGTLFLVRYDKLDGIIRDDSIHPLNSNIFFEWEKPDKIGSFIAVEKEIYEVEGIQYGRVTHVGTNIRYSARGLQMFDNPHQFKVGDRIMFDWFNATMIESQSHLTIFGGKEVYTIKSRDIIATTE